MRSYPSTSVTPLSLHSAPNLARTWNSPEDSSRTPEVLYDHEPASPTGITLQRKKSSSRLLVSNLGRRLTRVGSVMRRNTSDSAVTGSSSLKDSIRSRESQSASPGGDGGDELGRKRRWIKTRLRSATLPEEANPVSVSTLGTGDREAVMMRREEEGDEDITRPFNVEVSSAYRLAERARSYGPFYSRSARPARLAGSVRPPCTMARSSSFSRVFGIRPDAHPSGSEECQ